MALFMVEGELQPEAALISVPCGGLPWQGGLKLHTAHWVPLLPWHVLCSLQDEPAAPGPSWDGCQANKACHPGGAQTTRHTHDTAREQL